MWPSVQAAASPTALKWLLVLYTNRQQQHRVATETRNTFRPSHGTEDRLTGAPFFFLHFFLVSCGFLTSFVCSWHLSQKELRLRTPLCPVRRASRGEKRGKKEGGPGEEAEGDTGRKDEGGAERRASLMKTLMCASAQTPVAVSTRHPDHEPAAAAGG